MPNNNASYPEMVAKSTAIVEAFTPELYAYLLSLMPTPQSYAESHNRFEESYAASLKGDPEKVKAYEAERHALDVAISVLQGVAKAVTIKDPKVPKALGVGFVTEKAPPSTVILTVPHEFKVTYDPLGQITAAVTRVPGAKGYQVWACEGDPNVESNWRLVASSPNCRGIVIMGLNRGKPNWLRIRAMRGTGAGPWSNCVTLPT